MKLHHTLTEERILDMHERSELTLDDLGACIACGAEAHGVEGDARRYRCEACGALEVYGHLELVLEVL